MTLHRYREVSERLVWRCLHVSHRAEMCARRDERVGERETAV